MPVSHKLKIIFIHIPKNAGESIENTLGIYGGNPDETLWGVINDRCVLQHLTASELKDHFLPSETWDNYFKFAVVRNPWSKAVSEYNWYLRRDPKISFYKWVHSLKTYLESNKITHIEEVGHNIEQFKYIYDKNGNILVDRILRFENIKAEFNTLSAEKNWNVELLNITTTASRNKIDFQRYYDHDTIAKIAEIYSRDIEIFGYNEEETFRGFNI